MRALPALALCAVLAGPAWAQTEVRLSPVTVEGRLSPAPAPGGTARAPYYPPDAERQHIEGDVLLRCQIQAEGRFGDCEVVQETPKGADFARSALRIAASFAFPVPGSDGKPLSSGVATIPVRFRMARPAGGIPVPLQAAPGSDMWLKVPSPRRLQEAVAGLPSELLGSGTPIETVIECKVVAGGRLDACKVVSETSPGAHFGSLALRLMPEFQIRGQTPDGQPTEGGTIQIPLKVGRP